MNAKQEARTYSFVVLSAVTHVAMAIGMMALNTQSDAKDRTEIEILAETSTLPVISEAPVLAERARPAEAPQITEKPAAQVAAPIKAAPKATAPVAVVPVAAVLPDVTNTDLDIPASDVSAELTDEDIAEDLEKIDHDTSAQIAAVHEDLSHQADQELKAQEEKLAALKQMNEEQSKAAAQALEQRRQQERAESEARKAQAAAAEEAAKQAAAAEALAAQKAAEEARQAEAARLAEKAKFASDSGSVASAGSVRNLEDLRQMPGNKRPQYDSDDRLNRRQGEVAFVAYVSKEGAITEFKLVKSSGHRELDAKTLKALKSWKFYPGQEGWVEIPFQWDLKGDAKEKPATLRMKSQVSQNP